MRVLVREPIAEAGIELLRSRFDVDVDREAPLDGIIDRYDAHRDPLRDAPDPRAHRAGRAAQGDRPCRSGGRQRRRRRRDPSRDRRRERPGVDRHLGGGADDWTDRRARAQHPAGARRAQAGALGALTLGRGGALRQDARRDRVRPHRPAGRASRPRSRDERGRVRPVRRRTTASGTSASSRPSRVDGCSGRPTSSRSTRRSPTRRAA